MFYNDSNF